MKNTSHAPQQGNSGATIQQHARSILAIDQPVVVLSNRARGHRLRAAICATDPDRPHVIDAAIVTAHVLDAVWAYQGGACREASQHWRQSERCGRRGDHQAGLWVCRETTTEDRAGWPRAGGEVRRVISMRDKIPGYRSIVPNLIIIGAVSLTTINATISMLLDFTSDT